MYQKKIIEQSTKIQKLLFHPSIIGRTKQEQFGNPNVYHQSNKFNKVNIAPIHQTLRSMDSTST